MGIHIKLRETNNGNLLWIIGVPIERFATHRFVLDQKKISVNGNVIFIKMVPIHRHTNGFYSSPFGLRNQFNIWEKGNCRYHNQIWLILIKKLLVWSARKNYFKKPRR